MCSCEAWERLDWEGWVAGRAGCDEGSGKSVNFVEAEGSAVWVCGSDFAEVEPLKGGVDGLCDKDGSSNAEIFLASDEACTAEVGRCSHTLEDGSESHKGHWVRVREAVLACCHGRRACTLDGSGEQLHVLFLVANHVFQVGVVFGGESCREEH